MIVEIALGSFSGILTYVLVQKIEDEMARKLSAEKLDASNRFIKQSGL